jgi:hypothetical protein
LIMSGKCGLIVKTFENAVYKNRDAAIKRFFEETSKNCNIDQFAISYGENTRSHDITVVLDTSDKRKTYRRSGESLMLGARALGMV